MYSAIVITLAILFMRYFLGCAVEFLGDTIDIIRDIDGAVEYEYFRITTTEMALQGMKCLSALAHYGVKLLLVGNFLALLSYLSWHFHHSPIERSSRDRLQNEKDEALEIIHAQAAEIVVLEEVSTRLREQHHEAEKKILHLTEIQERSAHELDSLTVDLEQAQVSDNRAQVKLLRAQALLRLAEKNKDRSELALEQATGKITELEQQVEHMAKRLNKMRVSLKKSRAQQAETETNAAMVQSTIHGECLKNSEDQARQVKTLQNEMERETAQVHQLEKTLKSKTAQLEEAGKEHASELRILRQSTANQIRQQATTISELGEALEEKSKDHDLLKARSDNLITTEIRERDEKIERLDDLLTSKDACLAQAKADVQEMRSQLLIKEELEMKVQELTAKVDALQHHSDKLERELGDKRAGLKEAAEWARSGAVEDQLKEIKGLKEEIERLQKALAEKDDQLMDQAAMVLESEVGDDQSSKVVADLQTEVAGLQQHLEEARAVIRSLQSVGESMEVDSHQCDHSSCNQRELEQDSQVAKLLSSLATKDRQINELNHQLRAQSYLPTNEDNPSEIADLKRSLKEKDDKLNREVTERARATRDANMGIKKMGDLLRAKDASLEAKDKELQVEKTAAKVRSDEASREAVASYKKALDAMKVERDRSREGNEQYRKQAAEARAALQEAQKRLKEVEEQRDLLRQDGGKLMGEVWRLKGAAGESSGRKRENEEEAESPRPSKVSRDDFE